MTAEQPLFVKSDAVNYRELTEPLPIDQVNANMKAFADELYELRNKYRIADMLFVVRPSVKYDDGEIGCPMMLNHFGDSVLTEGMAAFAFGRASTERQENIQRVIEDSVRGLKNARRRK